MGRFGELIRFLKDVRSEMTRVQWAEPRQALMTTGVVTVFVIFTAIYLGGVDFVISKAMDWLLR